jgi:hypothetical protein
MVVGSTTDVGLDTSKKSIQVAMLLPGRRESVEWELANEPVAVKRLAKRLSREAVGELRVCYEAGPCGSRCSANFERRAWTRSRSLHRWFR